MAAAPNLHNQLTATNLFKELTFIEFAPYNLVADPLYGFRPNR